VRSPTLFVSAHLLHGTELLEEINAMVFVIRWRPRLAADH
jgi:hypothetical protein